MLEIVDMCSRFSQMDGDGQRALLSDLLDMCDTRLLAYVHEYATPRLKRDPFMVLPNELCLRVGFDFGFHMLHSSAVCVFNRIELVLTNYRTTLCRYFHS